MYPHHPFKPKRPRPWPVEEESLPSLTPSIPLIDLHYNSLPPTIRLQLDDIAQSYGISSGFQIHHNIQQQDQSRKRRRLEQQSSVTEDQTSPSAIVPIEKFSSSVYDTQQYDQFAQSSLWPEAGFAPMHYPTSPLAKRMADLSLCLCPSCGFGFRRSDGYQQLPEPPQMVYGPEKPYTIEKPPSMSLPCNTSDGPPNMTSEHQTTFACDQPIVGSSPLLEFPLLPDQSVVLPGPLVAEDDANLHINPPTAGYAAAPLMKQEPELTSPVLLSSHHLSQPSQFSNPYTPALLDLSAPTALVGQQPMLSTTDLPAFNMASSDCIPEMPLQGYWTEVPLMKQETDADPFTQQRGGKRGPFRDPGLREQTAQTRKIGSCIRCRMQRIRCEHNPDDPVGACLTCKRVANSRAGRFPCLRYKITDVRLYKPGQVPGYEWTSRWNNNVSDPIQGWASSEVKVIRLSEGLSDSKFVEFRVRQFLPQEGDKLERTWDHQGTKKSVLIPPYALVDLEDGRKAYDLHIRDSMGDAFKQLLGRPNGLLYKTYLKAWQMYRDPSTPIECVEILSRTLRLWMSIRFSTRSGFIVGEETLGMPQNILDETNPNHGSIPLPPVLGAQLDLILIHHIQTKLRRELLDRLQKMIAKNKQNTWLVTYLVIFILLHNTALITAHDASYARKHGMKRRFAREDKVREYFLGANILLAHFHYCNKGIYPFSDECKDQDLRSLAELNEDKIQFVHATKAYIKSHKDEWQTLHRQGAYEDDYFFISQLFEQSWQPGTMT